MSRITEIKKKINAIESLLKDLKSEVELLENEQPNLKTSIKKLEKSPPPLEEIKEFYDNLYSEFIGNNTSKVYDLLNVKTVTYLNLFCKINNLPIDTKKLPKGEVINSILQWLAQRKAITNDT